MTVETDTRESTVDITQIDDIIGEYEGQQWALIPLAQKVQERIGYIPPEAITRIADALRLSPAQVQGVITFYSQLYTTPRGRNVVKVCRGTACHVRGGKSILKLISQYLGIAEGETSEDMEYTLETVACIGVCALAPNIVINNETHVDMDPRKVARLFSGRREE